MLCILEHFGLRDTGHPVRGLLNIAEDRPPRPLVAQFQSDTVRIAQDNKIINLYKKSEPVLEGIIDKGQGHSKEDQTVYKILALQNFSYLQLAKSTDKA